MKAIFLDIERPMQSRLVDPAISKDLGGGAVSINRRLFKPVREFELKPWEQLLRDQTEILRHIVHESRVTGIFWLDGDQYADIHEPIFIGHGNGVSKEYPMPFNNVFAPSWVIYVNRVPRTDWTMKEEAGILVFSGTAPVGRITGVGKRKFRVIFKPGEDNLLSETQVHTTQKGEGVYSIEPIRLIEVEGVNSTT